MPRVCVSEVLCFGMWGWYAYGMWDGMLAPVRVTDREIGMEPSRWRAGCGCSCERLLRGADAAER